MSPNLTESDTSLPASVSMSCSVEEVSDSSISPLVALPSSVGWLRDVTFKGIGSENIGDLSFPGIGNGDIDNMPFLESRRDDVGDMSFPGCSSVDVYDMSLLGIESVDVNSAAGRGRG